MSRFVDEIDASGAEVPRGVKHPAWAFLLFPELGFLRHWLGAPVNAWALYNIAAIVLCLALSIAVHELGHAVVARAVGFRVLLVRIGRGRVVWEKTWRGCVLRVRPVPMTGITATRFAMLPALRWRLVLFTLGGVAGHAAVLAIVWLVLPAHRLTDIVHGSGAFFSRPSGIEVLVWIQLVMFFGNLLPIRTRIRLGARALWRDGGEALRALFSSQAELRRRAADCLVRDYVDAVREHDWAHALDVIDQARVLQPDRAGLRFSRGTLLLELHRFAEALVDIEAELEADRVRTAPSHSPCLVLTAYAITICALRDEARLAVALQAIEAADSLDPDAALTKTAHARLDAWRGGASQNRTTAPAADS